MYKNVTVLTAFKKFKVKLRKHYKAGLKIKNVQNANFATLFK